MKKSTFFVPALLAMTLVSGAAFAGNAISAPHGGGHGGQHEGGPAGHGGGMGGMGGCMGDGPGYHRGMGGCMGDGAGYHRGMGAGYRDMTPEKRAQYDTMMQEYHAKVVPMGENLYVKNQELRALQNAATPDVSAVSKKATEISELRSKVRAEKDAFMTKMEAEFGFTGAGHVKGPGKAKKM